MKGIMACVFASSLLVAGISFRSEASDGKSLFESKCSLCHGKDGKGKANLAKALKVDLTKLDLTDDESQKSSKKTITHVILKGQGKMKGFEGKISGEQAQTITAYVQTFGVVAKPKAKSAAKEGKAILKVRAQIKSLFEKKCASCHGKDGAGNPKMAPILKVDIALLNLIDKTSLEKSDKDLTRVTLEGAGKMKGYKKKISDGDGKALTTYIRLLGSQ